MDDINPYRHALADGAPGPVEVPWHWSLDDAIYALFSLRGPRPVFPNEHIFSIWKEEFDEIRRWGGLFDLVMHPQVIGRPSRIALLRRFVEYVQSFDDVRFMTANQVAEAYLAHDGAADAG